MKIVTHQYCLPDDLTPDEQSALSVCVCVYRRNETLADRVQHIAFEEDWALELMDLEKSNAGRTRLKAAMRGLRGQHLYGKDIEGEANAEVSLVWKWIRHAGAKGPMWYVWFDAHALDSMFNAASQRGRVDNL